MTYKPSSHPMDKPDPTPQQFSVYLESDTEEFHEVWASDVYSDAELIADVIYYMRDKNVQLSIVDNFLNTKEMY